MSVTRTLVAFCLLGTLLIEKGAEAVDENSAREQPCFNLTKTIPVDPKFAASLKTLYYPMLSRLELYRTSADLLQTNVSEIPESTLYYEGCLHWNFHPNGSIIATGFGGKTKEYVIKMILPNFESLKFGPAEGKGYAGTAYTTLTDNKTYFVAPFCTDDNEMTFAVGSTLPKLPEETVREIREHLLSLGFKKEYGTELKYDYCDMPGTTEMMMEATTKTIVDEVYDEIVKL